LRDGKLESINEALQKTKKKSRPQSFQQAEAEQESRPRSTQNGKTSLQSAARHQRQKVLTQFETITFDTYLLQTISANSFIPQTSLHQFQLRLLPRKVSWQQSNLRAVRPLATTPPMANIHTPIPSLKLNDGNSIPMVLLALIDNP
jgi:hypothetical protein